MMIIKRILENAFPLLHLPVANNSRTCNSQSIMSDNTNTASAENGNGVAASTANQPDTTAAKKSVVVEFPDDPQTDASEDEEDDNYNIDQDESTPLHFFNE